MMKYILILFTLVGCSTTFKNREIENYHQSAGVEKYFLSDIPSWANFSTEGQCHRQYTTRFFDIGLLMKNFNVDYSRALQIQGLFNDFYNREGEGGTLRSLPLLAEQNLFYKALEKINAGLLFFERPTFLKINLVWVDDAFISVEDEKRLKGFLKSSVFDSGVPVLLSLCYTKKELEEKFKDDHYAMITAELLSVFNANGVMGNQFKIDLGRLFDSKQILQLYTREKGRNTSLFVGPIQYYQYYQY